MLQLSIQTSSHPTSPSNDDKPTMISRLGVYRRLRPLLFRHPSSHRPFSSSSSSSSSSAAKPHAKPGTSDPIARLPTLQLSLAIINLTFLLHYINNHIGFIAACAGPSMIPTLNVVGDYVLIVRQPFRRGKGVRVGDLVDIQHPMVPGAGAIKRVVGMPGDFVCRDAPPHEEEQRGKESAGELVMGREGLLERRRAKEDGRLNYDDDDDAGGEMAEQWGARMMIQVPEGHCWVLGDNMPESRDSRTYGPLPLALIKGKVVARLRPFGEMCWLRNTLISIDES